MIPQNYRDALRNHKFENNLTYNQIGDQLKVTGHIARDIMTGRRSYVTIETAKAIMKIAGEIGSEA